ncbi:MAG: hypothetical protein U1E63_01430 [Burkholderiales bacterium]
MNAFLANLGIQQCVVAFSAMLISMPAWPGATGPTRDKSSAARASSSLMNRAGPGALQFAPSQNAQSKVYGKTYGEWAAEWQKWAYAGTSAQNAITDTDGRYCNLNQPKEGVWFLAGTFGQVNVTRTCTIPKGRALFYPLVEYGWIDCPGTPDEDLSDAQVRAILAGTIDTACQLTSTLDGVAIASLQVLTGRTQSPNFRSILPNDSVIADKSGCPTPLPGGKTGRQIVDGYWIMVPPLSSGKHNLTLHGALCNPNGPAFFENGVTYNLNVHNRSW